MQRRTGPQTAPERGSVPPWTMRRHREDDTTGRAQLIGALLIPVLATVLILHGLAQATTASSARNTLLAVLPALTDVDQALAVHTSGIQAAAAGDAATVPVPGLPAGVSVSREDARAGGAQLRRATVGALADRVYREGDRIFRAPDAKTASAPGLFTKQWAVRRGLDMFTAGSHATIARWRTVAAVVALALGALLAWQVDGNHRAAALGSVLAAGSALAVLAALAARGAVWLVGSDGQVTGAVLTRIARDLSMSIIAEAVVCGIAGLLITAMGVLVPRIVQGPAPEPVNRVTPRNNRFVTRRREE